MISKRSNILAGTVVIALLFTAVIPRSVFGIKNFSLVREAQAQEGEGIMQNIMPILLLMMLMNMMQQNKGNQLQREQADAAKNANSNLLQAGNQSSNGGNQPGLNESVSQSNHKSIGGLSSPVSKGCMR